MAAPWTWLRQVHGPRVVTVEHPGAGAGEEADAAVTSATGAVLAVHTADCGPVALVAEGGAVAVAHAGWRGVAAGVLEDTAAAVVGRARGPVRAVVGALIGPECYEFGAGDLDDVAARLGDGVRAVTGDGRPALDLPAAVAAALTAAGVEEVRFLGGCTACSDRHYSHRARAEVGRQALLAWIEP